MKMKRYLLFTLSIYFFTTVFSAAEAFTQSIPPFKMGLSTGKIFNAASDFKKEKPVILIYFDPDCDHCQKLMNELFKKINEFKNAEIVMVTFKSITEVTVFEAKYNTKKYTNISVGTEGSGFYLRDYFRLVKMPFTALYDKKENLSYTYRQETPWMI